MSEEADILFEVRGGLGVVTLNRPKALNALTLEMCTAFDRQLAAWAGDPAVRAVVVEGRGERAFCAGGDVRAVWRAGKDGEPLTADFFRVEYRLNRRIKTFAKPYIALIDGVTMGGGVGISVHGPFRVASERTLFAMPETSIGLFPDVGGSYFLPRLADSLGMYLALTGARLKAADALYAGVATHYVASARLGALLDALQAALAAAGPVEEVLASFADDPGPAPLAAHGETIARCFKGDSFEAILNSLAAESGEWAAQTLATLAACSPTSLKVTFEQIRRGAKLDFDAAMIMEYRLSQAFMGGHDFYEGIRATLIDKDNAPRWRPASLDEVTPAMVAAHFAPLGERDLTFE